MEVIEQFRPAGPDGNVDRRRRPWRYRLQNHHRCRPRVADHPEPLDGGRHARIYIASDLDRDWQALRFDPCDRRQDIGRRARGVKSEDGVVERRADTDRDRLDGAEPGGLAPRIAEARLSQRERGHGVGIGTPSALLEIHRPRVALRPRRGRPVRRGLDRTGMRGRGGRRRRSSARRRGRTEAQSAHCWRRAAPR